MIKKPTSSYEQFWYNVKWTIFWILFVLILVFTSARASTRITTYDNHRRPTASGVRVRHGIAAHASLPFGTVVEVKFKNGAKRRFVVADRGCPRGRLDVWVPKAGPGVLPDYGRTRIISRGNYNRKWTMTKRKAYILQQLRKIK